MLEAEWSVDKGWSRPMISPIHDLAIHPAAKVLHYAIEVSSHANTYSILKLY